MCSLAEMDSISVAGLLRPHRLLLDILFMVLQRHRPLHVCKREPVNVLLLYICSAVVLQPSKLLKGILRKYGCSTVQHHKTNLHTAPTHSSTGLTTRPVSQSCWHVLSAFLLIPW